MFLNKRYEPASVAFQRAGRGREVKICQAYLLREKARLISTTAIEARIYAFLNAAKAFVDCVRDSPEERVTERLGYLKASGECYLEARSYKKSGKNYLDAGEYEAAARAYEKGEYIDDMVEVINRHRDTMDSGLIKRLEMTAKLHYFEVWFNSNPAVGGS